MSANSLNRFTPVPPISPEQPSDEHTMSSSKPKTKPVPTVSPKQQTDEKTTLSSKTKPTSSVSPKQQTAEKPKTKLSRTPDVNHAASSSTVASKTSGVKDQSSAATNTAASGSTEKLDSNSQANCLQVEAQCNGEPEATLAPMADAVEHGSVQSRGENASGSTPNGKDASSTANESEADAEPDSHDRDENDDGESSTPVFYEATRRMLRLYHDNSISKQTDEDLEYIDSLITSQNIKLQIAPRLLNLGIVEFCQHICWKTLFHKKLFDGIDKDLRVGTEVLLRCLACVVNLTDVSKDACHRVIEIGLHEDMFRFLNLESMDPSKVPTFSYLHSGLADSAISVVYNVIQMVTEARELYREQGAVQILQKFRSNTNGAVSCLALILQAYVINEEENDLLGSVQFSFSFLSRELRFAVKNEQHRSPDGYKATEILAAINKLGINDDNKAKIVTSGALTSYVALLATGCSADEQYLSAQGLWTIAMKCPDDVSKQENCVTELKNLVKTSDIDGVRRQACGTLEALGVMMEIASATGTRLKNIAVSSHYTTMPTARDSTGSVFISYNHGSKSTVFKVRDRLRAAGFVVWIDEDELCDSIADSIINGLDQSSVVLVCLSQKYYESPYCKKEVVYAAESRKEMIPLTVEPRYKPHGWLKFHMSDKLRLDVSSDAVFHDSVTKLLTALRKIFSSKTAASVDEADGKARQTSTTASQPATAHPAATATAADMAAGGDGDASHYCQLSRRESSSADHKTLSWTSTEVNSWLKRNRLQHLADWFKDFDGQMLMEYKMLRLESPETFAACVQHELTTGRLTTADVLRLNHALKSL